VSELARNRCETAELSEVDVEAAIDRIARRDVDAGREAREVFDSLTWGEGPGVIRLAGLQEWLWYVVPTKYLTDEVGYMARFAATAADLFDELGLHAYAAVCRSDVTAGVHAAFDRSDSAGRTALRKAMQGSGIEPPDLDDFAWSPVMGVAESMARSAVQDALETAIAAGELVVGGRGWRQRQRQISAATLDSDHPTDPGQSWRTVVVTERIQHWVDAAGSRAPLAAGLRSRVANRVLHPIDPPADVADVVAPIVWFLEMFGDEQPLTQAGYLRPAVVQLMHREAPWDDPFPTDRPPRCEVDSVLVHHLRCWLQSAGAIRKHKNTLRRTRLGTAAASDAAVAWGLLTDNLADEPWGRFVVETAGLVMIDRGEAITPTVLFAEVAEMAGELGWGTTIDGARHAPSEPEVSQAFYGSLSVLRNCGVIVEHGDWRNRKLALADAGTTTMLAAIRASAAGPRQGPW